LQSNEASAQGGLTSFIENVIGDESLRIEESLGAGFVRLRVSEAERRQAKHDIQYVEDAVCEMVRNSRDAHAAHIFVASTREGSQRNLLVIDDGDGVPASIAEKVFEPRVTSKLESMHMDRWGVHGRGMALYSIRQNALSSHIVCSDAGRGCALRVVFDTESVPERADQSTLPSLVESAGGDDSELGAEKTRGPHNILRTVADVALDCPETQRFFVGSPAEVLATLVAQGRKHLAAHPQVGGDSCPFWLLPALATSPSQLEGAARTLGITVSQRSCYRILNFEVSPLVEIRQLVAGPTGTAGEEKTVDLLRDRRNLKLAPADVEEFSDLMARDFEMLAERYFLDLDDRPRVKVSKDKIVVTFPISKQL
jgi:hypothetical protein